MVRERPEQWVVPEVVTGNIEFYTLFPNIDITRTGDFNDSTQKDFESVVQLIGLRAQSVVMNNPYLNGAGANVLENHGAPKFNRSRLGFPNLLLKEKVLIVLICLKMS